MSEASAQTEQTPFWKRQFAKEVTEKQIGFDILAGIFLPVFCLCLDPIVFRGGISPPLLRDYAMVSYFAMSLGWLSLITCLLLRRPSSLLSGFLAGAAIFATALGGILLPYSVMALPLLVPALLLLSPLALVMGLLLREPSSKLSGFEGTVATFAGILGLLLLPFGLLGLPLLAFGLLGLAPFATACVFWRNSVRAYPHSVQDFPKARAILAVAAGLAFSCGGPWAADHYVRFKTSRAIEFALSSDPAQAAWGVSKAKRYQLFVDLNQLARDYQRESNEQRRQGIERLFVELTGQAIDEWSGWQDD